MFFSYKDPPKVMLLPPIGFSNEFLIGSKYAVNYLKGAMRIFKPKLTNKIWVKLASMFPF
jgi:hypothetical protein